MRLNNYINVYITFVQLDGQLLLLHFACSFDITEIFAKEKSL